MILWMIFFFCSYFFFTKKKFLVILLILEFLMLGALMKCALMNIHWMFFMLVLFLGACEATMGLCMFISMLRSGGSNYVNLGTYLIMMYIDVMF